MSGELSPCPFCGHPPVLRPIKNDGRWIADCNTVTCIRPTTGLRRNKSEAIAAWNPRATEAEATELREEIARLRALLENVTDRLEWLVAACQPDEAGPTFRPDSYFVRMARGSVEHVRAALEENIDG